jgi:hypothetical protein
MLPVTCVAKKIGYAVLQRQNGLILFLINYFSMVHHNRIRVLRLGHHLAFTKSAQEPISFTPVRREELQRRGRGNRRNTRSTMDGRLDPSGQAGACCRGAGDQPTRGDQVSRGVPSCRSHPSSLFELPAAPLSALGALLGWACLGVLAPALPREQ